MNFFLTLSQNDFRTTFRDPIFKGLLFFPFISFALSRWVLPYLTLRFPAVAPYTPVILMWACLQSATMFGFIYGFLFLEEKEENLREAIRVMPISGLKLIFSRMFVGLVISTAVNFCLMRWGNIVDLSWDKEILLSFQFSLAAPLIALSLGAFAQNRIEGMAQMKILNILLVVPGLIYFLPYDFLHITALLPTYWSFRSMELAMTGGNGFMLFFAIGSAFYVTGIALLNYKFTRMS